ncbi:MAG TPA: IS21 family transposase [Streptosporangiaceae bacterium]|nr:IS21 family transposase [Streptosporangiaceae bacterium]
MITHPEYWMDIRKYRVLHEAGLATYAEIAAETGCDWRTVKKYLDESGPAAPPEAGTPRKGTQPRLIGPVTPVIDAWLKADVRMRASVIHERLADEHGFTVNYQRVKMYVAEARPRIRRMLEEQRREEGEDNPAGRDLHRRFETLPGAQAQVDWGEERGVLIGVPVVYSFHMTLGYSREPFCCYVTRTDIAMFFACHIRAFEYFGGVPEVIVYDRTKTVVKRHVAPRKAVPLHPEAVAFAGHYGFGIDVLGAYRPTGKGKVERYVEITRSHVLSGRAFYSLEEMDEAFLRWAPIRAAQVHRTHGEVIGDRAAKDRAALRPLPAHPYLVAEQHLRQVGKDCLVQFESSMYSVPAKLVSPGQRVHVRAGDSRLTVHALPADGGGLLAIHERARQRGSFVVDESHWDGLPDGHTRAVTAGGEGWAPRPARDPEQVPGGLGMLLAAHPDAAAPVARRPLSDYEPGA